MGAKRERWKDNPCPWHWMEKAEGSTCRREEGVAPLKLHDEDLQKSLYICTSEREGVYNSYNIRAIKLSDLLIPANNQLQQVAYDHGGHLPAFAGCGVFGSEIVFAGGNRIQEYGSLERNCSKDLYVFDTRERDSHEPQPKVFKMKKMEASFRRGKHRPLLVELNGKRYSLSGKPIFEPAPANPAFEVFDPVNSNWTPLAEPPFLVLDNPDFKFAPFSYIVSGTKILVSSREIRKIRKIRENQGIMVGLEIIDESSDDESEDEALQESQDQALEEQVNNHVFCFDVAQPHIGWRKLSNCFVKKNGIPFVGTPFHGRALTLDLANLKLVFTYAFDEKVIQLFLMFYFEEKVVELGKLSIQDLPPEFTEPTEYSFIHLRDHTVCLILSRFTQSRWREDDHYTVYEPGTQKIVLVPFTFTCVDDWWWRFSFQFMSTKVLEYQTNEDCNKQPEVLGCFIL